MQRRWVWALVFFVCIPLLVLGIMSSLLSLLPSLFALEVFDHVVVGNNPGLIPILIFGGLVGLFLMCLLDITRGVVWHRCALWLEAWAFPRIIHHSLLTRRTDGVLRDLSAIRSFASLSTLPIAFDFMLIPLFMTLIDIIHPYFLWIALLGLLLLVLSAAMAGLLTDRMMEQMSEKYGGIRDAVMHVATYIGPPSVLALHTKTILDDVGDVSILQRSVYDRVAIFSAFSRFIRASIQFLCTGVGAELVISHRIGVGAMIGATLLVMRAVAPAEALLTVLKPTSRAIMAWRRVWSSVGVADVSWSNHGVIMGPNVQGSVRSGVVSWVGVLMPTGTEVDVHATMGKLSVIVGGMGSGKTYIAHQCVGVCGSASLSVPGMGSTICGARIAVSGIGWVPDTGIMVPDTVVSDFFPPDFTWDSMKAIAKDFGIHDLDRYVSPRLWGTTWSDMSLGQRKLLSLLSVLCTPMTVVVLDDPMMGIDVSLVPMMSLAIASLKYTGTSILCMVKHTELLRYADVVYTLNGDTLTLRQ